MDINKVEYNGENGTETLIDLTADTVTPETLVKGATAHDKSGANIIGNADYAILSTSTTSPITDSADALVQGLTIYGRSKKSKNLLEITAESQTVNGVTFTVDKAAGTITANGTATDLIYFFINDSCNITKDDDYIITWYESLGNAYVALANVSSSSGDTATTRYDNLPKGTYRIFFRVAAGTTLNNETRQILFCTVDDYEADPTFEPYFEGIKSVGDDGLTVTTANSDNTLTTSAEFTTALPLRSTLDGATRDELIIGNGKAEVITRCEVVDDSIVPLATPVTTPLTSTEISAFRGLKTYDNTTNITITDSPDFEIDYLKNAENGQAVADIQRDLQGQIDGITVELTQAEYDALTEEEKNNGVIYFITDAPSGITIDNELSATSTNAVQNRVITSQVNKILSEAEILAQINDRIYQGTDLTVKFADEISASPYNGDPWAWIKSRIQAENFAGIHVGDYIPFTTTNGVTLNAQIAGINTYKNYGDSPVGAHIDFICKELWPTLHPVNKVNYNNGTSAQSHPWLASDLYLYLNSLSGDVPNGTSLNPETVAVDYTADGVYYFLPTQLKNVIIEKKFLLPTRYSASGLLSDDNSWAWKNIGKLWLPDECEVYGMPVWGGKGGYSLGGSALQYPLFAGNMNRLKFRNGGRSLWWLLSPYSGGSSPWCIVGSDGGCNYLYASHSNIAAPVCLRVG